MAYNGACKVSYSKGGFMSEDAGEFLHCQIKYSKSLSWAKNLNKLFTVLGGKFKFSAQDSDMEYLCWQCKNSPVSSDLKPPLHCTVHSVSARPKQILGTCSYGCNHCLFVDIFCSIFSMSQTESGVCNGFGLHVQFPILNFKPYRHSFSGCWRKWYITLWGGFF